MRRSSKPALETRQRDDDTTRQRHVNMSRCPVETAAVRPLCPSATDPHPSRGPVSWPPLAPFGADCRAKTHPTDSDTDMPACHHLKPSLVSGGLCAAVSGHDGHHSLTSSHETALFSRLMSHIRQHRVCGFADWYSPARLARLLVVARDRELITCLGWERQDCPAMYAYLRRLGGPELARSGVLAQVSEPAGQVTRASIGFESEVFPGLSEQAAVSKRPSPSRRLYENRHLGQAVGQ